MNFPLENCIVADLHFSAPQVQKLLQYPHLLTYVLLDLQLLEKEINKLGKERAIADSLSREELEEEIIDYLSKKQPCSLATCGKDGAPRISVVDYINEGPTICLNLNMV